VETTLSYALTYISTVASPVIQPSSITILADDSYYTQPTTDTTSVQAKEVHKFSDFGVRLSDAHKTGLGSSAALVTALTAALLVHYLPKETFSVHNDAGQTRLHNLAQAAHCAAQGKVGSGFDVASAVYGSCLYRRFSPSVLKTHGEPGSSGFARRIKDLVEDGDKHIWDTEIFKDAVKVPKGIRMVMCDVDCGSQTPGMVKQMLAWREKESDEANMIWAQLDKKNSALAAELTKLTDTASGDYAHLKQAITDIRVLIQEMSRLSGVPVEPMEQTRLIDACSEIEGVIGGVVPGAGGYDAIALLVEDKEEVIANLQKLLKEWKVEAYKDVTSGPSMGKVSMLPVREEMEGIRVEDASKYGGWIA
jgi:phosphomevalonate kinase